MPIPLEGITTALEEEEEDPTVGGQWRIATLSRRGKCSPAAGTALYWSRTAMDGVDDVAYSI
jgi:hypothetical protein